MADTLELLKTIGRGVIGGAALLCMLIGIAYIAVGNGMLYRERAEGYAAGWCEARGTPIVTAVADGDAPPVCAVVVP